VAQPDQRNTHPLPKTSAQVSTAQQLAAQMIACEKGLGKMLPNACVRRWRIANGKEAGDAGSMQRFCEDCPDGAKRSGATTLPPSARESRGPGFQNARGNRKCRRCGTEFAPKSGSQRYCKLPECVRARTAEGKRQAAKKAKEKAIAAKALKPLPPLPPPTLAEKSDPKHAVCSWCDGLIDPKTAWCTKCGRDALPHKEDVEAEDDYKPCPDPRDPVPLPLDSEQMERWRACARQFIFEFKESLSEDEEECLINPGLKPDYHTLWMVLMLHRAHRHSEDVESVALVRAACKGDIDSAEEDESQ